MFALQTHQDIALFRKGGMERKCQVNLASKGLRGTPHCVQRGEPQVNTQDVGLEQTTRFLENSSFAVVEFRPNQEEMSDMPTICISCRYLTAEIGYSAMVLPTPHLWVLLIELLYAWKDA